VDHKKGERYSKEFRQQAVERMNAGDNISRRGSSGSLVTCSTTGVTGWRIHTLQLDDPAS
jgi:hypothetical protein